MINSSSSPKRTCIHPHHHVSPAHPRPSLVNRTHLTFLLPHMLHLLHVQRLLQASGPNPHHMLHTKPLKHMLKVRLLAFRMLQYVIVFDDVDAHDHDHDQ